MHGLRRSVCEDHGSSRLQSVNSAYTCELRTQGGTGPGDKPTRKDFEETRIVAHGIIQSPTAIPGPCER